jgi:fructose-1,6-bisphosphatase/inositol monophosphatase family enzyme
MDAKHSPEAMPSPQEFVRTLSPALEQAAAIASALQGRVPNVPKPGEATPVKAALTIADTAAQEALLVPLLARFRAARLEAEEETHSVELFTGAAPAHRIVVDPIDGTLHFYLAGRGGYAVMAGFAIDGRYEAALVALPREELRFDAVRGAGARRGPLGAESEPATCSRTGDRLLLSDGVPDPVEARLRAEGFATDRACGGAVALAPLVPGVRGGLRVSKYATISVRGRIGTLIAREAGALVETLDGAPFPDSLDDAATSLVVTSDPETAAAIRFAVRR